MLFFAIVSKDSYNVVKIRYLLKKKITYFCLLWFFLLNILRFKQPFGSSSIVKTHKIKSQQSYLTANNAIFYVELFTSVLPGSGLLYIKTACAHCSKYPVLFGLNLYNLIHLYSLLMNSFT